MHGFKRDKTPSIEEVPDCTHDPQLTGFCVLWCTEQTLARVVESTERHFKAAGRRTGLPLPEGPIEDRDYFRLWPKVRTVRPLLCGACCQ